MCDTGDMDASGIRARVRAELTDEIKQIARRQLAEEGAAALSLRAVARELGMVSSAVYRYFASRDELLTALIVDAYDAIGVAAEAADRRSRRGSPRTRWTTIGRAVRGWALEHPHEYALIYGSPVPGYAAPSDTVGPATRVARVLALVLCDAVALGECGSRGETVPRKVRADLVALSAALEADIPPDVLVRGLMAWVHLFGTISFELFGQYHNVISDAEAYFDLELDRLADFVGFA
jgi:AcrR family transcriptional regulator